MNIINVINALSQQLSNVCRFLIFTVCQTPIFQLSLPVFQSEGP